MLFLGGLPANTTIENAQKWVEAHNNDARAQADGVLLYAPAAWYRSYPTPADTRFHSFYIIMAEVRNRNAQAVPAAPGAGGVSLGGPANRGGSMFAKDGNPYAGGQFATANPETTEWFLYFERSRCCVSCRFRPRTRDAHPLSV
jgi:hypothetical protein